MTHHDGADRCRADGDGRRRAPRTHRHSDQSAKRRPEPHTVDAGWRHRVAIRKLRVGSFFPSLLEPRRRVDQALWVVIMTAYITGTSTRKVDDLVRALGCESTYPAKTALRAAATSSRSAWIT